MKVTARTFVRSRRGLMIQCLVKLSNLEDDGYRLTKQGLEVGLYLTLRGKVGFLKYKYFIKSLSHIAEKVQCFSGREKFSNNGMSEALKSLNHHGFLVYEYEKANLIDKHGDKRGIKIKLLKRAEYKALLEKLGG